MGIERDIERLETKQTRLTKLLNEGYRTRNGTPFASVSVDREAVKRELDNVDRNIQRLTPRKYTGSEEHKERDRLQQEGETLRANMLSKDESMGKKTGRADGHNIRDFREEDVRKQMEFDRKYKKRKMDYDKDVERFNYNVQDTALPKSEQIRRGGKEYT